MREFIHCCPFCGSHKVEICRTNENACWIRCSDCGGESSGSKTRKKAIANWNARYFDEWPSMITDDADKECIYK